MKQVKKLLNLQIKKQNNYKMIILHKINYKINKKKIK
jgi:hypothetical protein